MSNEELARRAVACKHWRWMPGMLALDTGLRLDEMTDDWEAEIPDFSDPATMGCLLALVREVWGPDTYLRLWANPAPDMSGKSRSKWEPVDGLGRRLAAGPRVLCATEAEALVAALEAADD